MTAIRKYGKWWTRCAIFCCGMAAAPAAMLAQTPDTIASKRPLLTQADLRLAAAFTAGAATVASADRPIADWARSPAGQRSRLVGLAATGFRRWGEPGAIATAMSLYAAGLLLDRDRMADLGLHAAEAILVANATTYVIKSVVGRARPYVNGNPYDVEWMRGIRNRDYRSFPSGHTTAAFAFAAAVTSETSRWHGSNRWLVGTVAYGAATLTGLSRLYNNEHWASDVLGGAGVGTIAGLAVVRFQHSHPANSLDNLLLRAGVSVLNSGSVLPVFGVIRIR